MIIYICIYIYIYDHIYECIYIYITMYRKPFLGGYLISDVYVEFG